MLRRLQKRPAEQAEIEHTKMAYKNNIESSKSGIKSSESNIESGESGIESDKSGKGGRGLKIFRAFCRAFCLFQALSISAALALFSCSAVEEHPDQQEEGLTWLSFDPYEIEGMVLELINSARESIEVSLYGLKNQPITDALIDAYHNRQVKVRLSTEYDSESSPSWQELIRRNLPVSVGNSQGIMHNKYFIIDGRYILTGSTNLTEGMFRHYNNAFLIRSRHLAQEFQRDFEIQYAGYYGGSKDEGYQIVTNSQKPWRPLLHEMGGFHLQAYFTPYKRTFNEYTPPLPPPGIIACSQSCLAPPPSSQSSHRCPVQDCKDQLCYKAASSSRSLPKLIYRHRNYDREGEFYCSAYDNAMNRVVPLIETATSSILVLAFAFRDRLIADRLIDAHRRGVEVQIYIDYNQYRSGYNLSKGTFEATAAGTGFLKICRRLDGGLLHHKVIVIDDETVIAGSMNFSQNAVVNNDENFVIVEGLPSFAKAFRQEALRIDRESLPLRQTATGGG